MNRASPTVPRQAGCPIDILISYFLAEKKVTRHSFKTPVFNKQDLIPLVRNQTILDEGMAKLVNGGSIE